MKKYIKPRTEVITLHNSYQLLSGSDRIVGGDKGEYTDGQQSRRGGFFFDDEEEEEY